MENLQSRKRRDESELVEKEGKVWTEFVGLVNEGRSKADIVRAALTFFQEQSGCEAVGIRLREGDDYPYHEARGFPQEFVHLENNLCARDECGQPLRDSGGYPIMECMCGNVIQGRFDPSKSFFSPKGSFWTNCTTDLLATSTEADRQARTRNRCNGEGYESVALIALRAGEERLGLLQLNDRRKGRFSPETIALWERLAGHLAVALAKVDADEHLRENEAHYRSLFDNMLNGFAYCKMVFDGDVPTDFTYLEVNGAFERLTGLKDVAGRRVSEVIPGIRESNPEIFEIYGRVALTGKPERFETWVEPLAQWFSVSVYRPRIEHFVAVFDVITERKRMEEELKASRAEAKARAAELAAVLEALPAITFIAHDPACRRMTCGRAGREFLRLPEGANASKSAPEEDRPINFRALKDGRELSPEELPMQTAAFTGHEVRDSELTIAFDDGSKRDILGNAVPLFDLTGSVSGAVGAFVDITELKRAEEALRESEERYRSLFNDSPVALIELDGSGPRARLDALFQQGITDLEAYLNEHPEEVRQCASLIRFTDANATFVHSYGTESKEALLPGLTSRFTSDAVFLKTFRDGLAAISEGRFAHEYETTRRVGGGKSVYEYVRWSVPAGYEKTWSRVLISVMDITARKEAEEALRETEERYRVAIENSNDGVSLSREGGHFFVNQRFCEIFGYTREEALNLDRLMVVHPDERQMIEEIMVKRMKGEQAPTRYEFKGMRKDGISLDIEVSVVPVVFRGGHVFLAYFRDITERKKAEELIRMNEKRLQTLMDAAPVGISWTDPSGNMVYCNRKFTNLFGYTLEDVPTINDWRNRAYPDPAYRESVRPLVPAILEAQQQGREVRPIEVMVTCKDGSTRWVAQTGAAASSLNLAIYTDLTERKKAEASLRESENKFRDLAEKSVVGVYLMQDGIFRYVNSRFAEMHGYEVDELIDQKGPPDMFGPEERRQLQKALRKRPGGAASTRSQEFTITTKEGTTRSVEVYSALTTYKGKKAVIGTLVDVTERKAVEDALRGKTAFLEALLDVSRDGIVVTDGQARIILVNRRAVAQWKIPNGIADGRDEKGWRSHVLSMVKDPDRLNEQVSYLESHPEESVREEAELVDGTILDRYSSPIVGKDGTYYGRIFGYHDITERRRSEKLLKQIVQSSPMGIFILQNGKTQLLNTQFQSITGYTEEEAVGMSLLDLVHPDDRSRVKDQGRKMVKGELTAPYEYRIITKSGEIRTLMETVTPIDYKGANATLGNVVDTTDRRILESQLAQSQKLEAIGQLAAGIAHEINTPIQYVGDNVTFLRDAFGDTLGLLEEYHALVDSAKEKPLDGEAIAHLEQKAESIDLPYLKAEIPKAISQSLEGVGRVAKIVLAMKEFSHPGTREKNLVDINRAIENTITVSRNEWKYVSDLETDFDDSLPQVPCLLGEFNQVILNIIVNAAQAMKEIYDGSGSKGTIKVATRPVDDAVEIRISDTGPGIPESIRSRIFDPFFTTKEVGKGTGQGLAIARSVIVDKHKGTIDCETEPGKGATFIIRMPLEDNQKGG